MNFSPEMYYTIALQNLMNRGQSNAIAEQKLKEYIENNQFENNSKTTENTQTETQIQSVETQTQTNTQQVENQPTKEVETANSQPSETQQVGTQQTNDENQNLSETQQQTVETFDYMDYHNKNRTRTITVIVIVILVLFLAFAYYQFIQNKKIMKKYKKLSSIVEKMIVEKSN